MNSDDTLIQFEVHYRKGEEELMSVVAARYPSEAQLLFQRQHQGEELMVMCVIRHHLGSGE